MEYTCEYCNFNTKKKYNYDKHLLSNKHKLVESKSLVSLSKSVVSPTLVEVSQKLAKSSIEISNLFKCKYCDKGYKHGSSLSKHIKYSCNKNKTENLTEKVRLLILQLEYKDKQLETQAKQIDKLIEKLEINTYNTNSNNTINNININLLNYKDTSHLINVDYKKKFLDLIEIFHFNSEENEEIILEKN